MKTVIPELILPKVVLTTGDDNKVTSFAALARSRRHQVPEKQSHNTLLTCHRLDDAERSAIAGGADLYIGQVSFRGPTPEVLVHVGRDIAADYYAAEPATQDVLIQRKQQAEAAVREAAQNLLAELSERDATAAASGKPVDHLALSHSEEKALKALGNALNALAGASTEAGVGLAGDK